MPGKMDRKNIKGIMDDDIRSTFMDIEEFADVHVVNGKEMSVLVDDNEIVEREKKEKTRMDGIWVKQKLIYVMAGEFGALPAAGRAILFDGKTYIVQEAVDEQGIYSILMEANRTK